MESLSGFGGAALASARPVDTEGRIRMKRKA
jgi:hypothetical protein